MAGTVEHVADGVRRIVAPNPSALTYTGTNSYILGAGAVAIIDPGPDIPAHLDALLQALSPGEHVAALLVTHAHLDHSPLARPLAEVTGAPIYAGGGAFDGRSETMQALAASGLAGGGEGLDLDFAPDHIVTDNTVIDAGALQITAIATPGHLGSHLAFAWGDLVFSGDHVMGWATTLISPPDGDMGAYMASLDRLAGYPAHLYLPGHGPKIDDPATRIAELIAHRRAREAAILAHLSDTPQTASALAHSIYTDIDAALLPMAARNVLAHLVDLTERNLAHPDGPLGAATGFRRA